MLEFSNLSHLRTFSAQGQATSAGSRLEGGVGGRCTNKPRRLPPQTISGEAFLGLHAHFNSLLGKHETVFTVEFISVTNLTFNAQQITPRFEKRGGEI